ncbi:MAG: chlorophyll synthesis pathway protein BchC [Pseudomonadota bacterium]
MQTQAVILEKPGALTLRGLGLTEPGANDVVVDMRWSGISTGTEKLLWSGEMPWFPGLEYPLVPGYEGVGDVIACGADADIAIGTRVLVPGANCFEGARGLFGASASRVVVPAARVVPVDEALGADATLLSLAATAQHAIAASPNVGPTLVVGHGVVGRLIARALVARGDPAPMVWECRAERRDGAKGYDVIPTSEDPATSYATVFDASGDPAILDTAIARLAKGGEIVLAGFYAQPLQFAFPPAFMREARIRIAAEWTPTDMATVRDHVERGTMSLDGLVTHTHTPADPARAFTSAFADPACLKMILDWRSIH